MPTFGIQSIRRRLNFNIIPKIGLPTNFQRTFEHFQWTFSDYSQPKLPNCSTRSLGHRRMFLILNSVNDVDTFCSLIAIKVAQIRESGKDCVRMASGPEIRMRSWKRLSLQSLCRMVQTIRRSRQHSESEFRIFQTSYLAVDLVALDEFDKWCTPSVRELLRLLIILIIGY